MKKIMCLYLPVAFSLLILVSQEGSAQSDLLLEVTNPLKQDRKNEMVTLSWSEVRKYLPSADPASVILRGSHMGEAIALQTMDTDQDGTVEQLLFLIDLKAMETKSFILREGKSPGTSLPSMTDARFMVPREDLAWENDRVAFRMYGPSLAAEVNNGIDVWCKRVRSLILEKWYKADEAKTASYHIDHGEGADFFAVGRTLGGGGSALWKNDSLYQPGVFESHNIIATGPIRAVFELQYKAASIEGRPIRETRRVTLDAGQNLSRFDVTYAGSTTGSKLTFAVGVVKRNNVVGKTSMEHHWGSLYGPTTDKDEDGFLGTAVLMPHGAFKEFREDKTHLLILGNAEAGKPVTYYAGGGWTRSGDFSNAQDWETYLNEYALRLKSPLTVRVTQRTR